MVKHMYQEKMGSPPTPLRFDINEIEYESKLAKVTSSSRSQPSGIFPSVRIGVNYSKIAKSTKFPKANEIKNIEFEGMLNLQKGDEIIAYIKNSPENFNETEKVSKIEKLSGGNDVLATFNAIDWSENY